MPRRLLVLLLLITAGAAAGGAAACSSSKNTTTSPPTADAGDDAQDAGAGVTPEIPCTDSSDSVYADPGDVSAQPKGAILKCAHYMDFTAAELHAALGTSDTGTPLYAGRPFTSGAHVYRVLYRTERGDPNHSPGYSSALVLLPDSPRASKLPVLVASHGSRGEAGACAPSSFSARGAFVAGDYELLAYPLVGFGYAVIAPDLAGYANFGAAGNPPSAYGNVGDVGKSTLDGARALRNLVPSSLTSQNVLAGHSQGGQTTFAALSMAASYAPELEMTATVTYAPLWWSQRAWVLLFFEPSSYPIPGSAGGPTSVLYHYTHGELLDGPGHGADMFDPSKQAAVEAFVNNDCWAADYPQLDAVAKSANDLFLASYESSVESAALSGDCQGDATCQKWLDRMTADWPHLTAAAAKVPTLVLYAPDDKTITPDLMACVYRRLSEDQLNYQTCFEDQVPGHDGALAAKSDYVADWIAHQTLGAPAPTEACPPLPTDDAGVPQIPGPEGGTVPCNPLLPDK